MKFTNSALLFSFLLLSLSFLIIYVSPAFPLNSTDGISKDRSRSIIGSFILYYVLYAISIIFLFREGAKYFHANKSIIETTTTT